MTLSPKDVGLCGVFAVALPLGQMLFKWGAVYDKQLSGAFLMRVMHNYPLIGAFAWYGLTALLWFYVLIRVPLSLAYGFSLVGSCLVPLAGWRVFTEQVSWPRAAGYALMLAGLFLVVRPA